MKRTTLYAATGAIALVLVLTVAAAAFLVWDGARGTETAKSPFGDPGEGGIQLTAGNAPGESGPSLGTQAEKDAYEALTNVQRRFQSAVRNRDVEAVTALMTPDFTQKSADGRVINRQQAEAEMRATWPSIVSIDDWSLKMVNLRLRGDTAVGEVRERLVATVKDLDGKPRSQTVDSRSRNTWVRTSGGWKYKRMEDLGSGEALGGIEYVSSEQWQNQARARRATQTTARPQKERPASGGAAITRAEARQMLDEAYAKFRGDVRRKDAKAALSSLSANYAVEYPTHTEIRSAVERNMKSDLQATETIHEWNQTIRGVSMDGNTLKVTLDDRKTATYRTPSGKKFRGRVDATMEDTWTRTRDGWKNSRTRVLRIRAYQDGKLVRKVG